jgi:integrase/recombinase XerD
MFSQNQSQALVVLPALAVAPQYGESRDDQARQATMSELGPYFAAYLQFELRRSPETVSKYAQSLKAVIRTIGDMPPEKIRQEHVLLIKAATTNRGVGPCQLRGYIAALKSFLNFCKLTVGLAVMDTRQIRGPRIPKREVQFLTPEEVQKFVSSIPLRKSQRKFYMRGLCFRALVEVLLGTGMRISEALSLRRSSINIQTGEAKIVGKGNKERTVFFSPRALNWVREYLNRRLDENDALFVCSPRIPLNRPNAIQWFRKFRKKAGIQKNITAHILRHTMATTLLFNGCPIGHIKQLLGHENLQTTCQYYLGTDKRAAKEAHRKYLDYETVRREEPSLDF